MTAYEQHIIQEVKQWQKQMRRRPSIADKISRGLQSRVNRIIPEKIHLAITNAIKGMTRGVLYGAKYTTAKPLAFSSLQQAEESVEKRINFYKNAAAAEGGITGAGGILLNLADFPILLGMKLKLLFDIAAMYGYSVQDYKERLYILYIFQLAFSSQQHRREVFAQIADWENTKNSLPEDVHLFNWRGFQQEYRDYIDLAKLAQMIPGIGAVVGYVVNKRLITRLGITAMNAYRMRWMEKTIPHSL